MKTEDLNINGVDIVVDYDFYPEEPCRMYYNDMSGHPGSPASVEIYGIYAGETDIYELVCGKTIRKIEEQLIDLNERW